MTEPLDLAARLFGPDPPWPTPGMRHQGITHALIAPEDADLADPKVDPDPQEQP